MKDVLVDIFTRMLAPITDEQHSCLRVDQVSPVEDNQTLKVPIGTALIVGIDGQKQEPIAILAVTSPELSPDSSDLLTFVLRRAHAYKAPYFITWTLRDAVIWKTPNPGTPAERSHIQKIRAYEDLHCRTR